MITAYDQKNHICTHINFLSEAIILKPDDSCFGIIDYLPFSSSRFSFRLTRAVRAFKDALRIYELFCERSFIR